MAASSILGGRIPSWLTLTLLVAALSLHQLPSSAASPISLWYPSAVRRASYWPGMWQFNRDSVGDDYADAPVGKRANYRPGMWQFDRNRKLYEKRGYYWPGMWQAQRTDDFVAPEGAASDVAKRANYWPGMWRYQQLQEAPLGISRRSSYMYERYWLGKACGETGDAYACDILNGVYDY